MPGCGARGGATKRKENLRANERFDSVGKLRKKMGRREGEAMVTESVDRIFRSVKNEAVQYRLSNRLLGCACLWPLPNALGAYRNLAKRDYRPERNYFDKKYYQVIVDKWIPVRFDNQQSLDTDMVTRSSKPSPYRGARERCLQA